MEEYEVIENEIYPEMDESKITATVLQMKEASKLPVILCGILQQDQSEMHAFTRLPNPMFDPLRRKKKTCNFLFIL